MQKCDKIKRGSSISSLPLSLLLASMMLSSYVLFACGKNSTDMNGEEMSSKSIEQVLKERTPELMSMPGVVGTGQGLCDGQPCIKVFVKQKSPELESKIAEILEDTKYAIEETGEFRAYP